VTNRMEAFLTEMAWLAGQEAGPVLELQFGDTRTLTMLQQDKETSALSISVLLPRDERLGYLEASLFDGEMGWGNKSDITCLWHADKGCYAMIRNIPLRQISDERSVFDAILDTVDQAENWYSCLQARLGHSH